MDGRPSPEATKEIEERCFDDIIACVLPIATIAASSFSSRG